VTVTHPEMVRYHDHPRSRDLVITAASHALALERRT
jgi:hypothetical protein